MEYYNLVIAKNPKVEMIFHSWDKDAAEMRTFISKHRITCPSFRHGILATSRASIPNVAKHIPQKLPYFTMINREGEEVAPGDTDLAAIKRFFAEQEAKGE